MIPFVLFAVVTSVLSSNEICPGGNFTCPDFATCCQLVDKSYGCCPMQNAVCCDDHIHCCPMNTKCSAGLCVQLNGLNVNPQKLTSEHKDIPCSDTGFVCPDDSTCCKGLDPGTYGCCPMERAVCCIDGTHCCPEGTTCDLAEGKCIGKGFISEMYDSNKNKVNVPAHSKYSMLEKSKNVSSIVCPGMSFQCPDGYTCCKLPDGSWGCCPFANATCCNDHLHCCPENMQCDATSQACSKGSKSISSAKKILAKPIRVGLVCPDNTTCADLMTCCKMMGMHFGCCPYPNAMCCSDGSHCCPDGFMCDVEQKQCLPKNKSLKKPAVFKYRVNMF